MSKKYRVNDGTQIAIGDKVYVGGQTFSATDAELDEHGSRPYVEAVKEAAKDADDKAAPKAADKAMDAPAKAGTDGGKAAQGKA